MLTTSIVSQYSYFLACIIVFFLQLNQELVLSVFLPKEEVDKRALPQFFLTDGSKKKQTFFSFITMKK